MGHSLDIREWVLLFIKFLSKEFKLQNYIWLLRAKYDFSPMTPTWGVLQSRDPAYAAFQVTFRACSWLKREENQATGTEWQHLHYHLLNLGAGWKLRTPARWCWPPHHLHSAWVYARNPSAPTAHPTSSTLGGPQQSSVSDISHVSHCKHRGENASGLSVLATQMTKACGGAVEHRTFFGSSSS